MSARDFRVTTGSATFETHPPYRLLVPPDSPPAGGWPLVVCLHGMGMTADQFSIVLNDLLDPRAAWLFPQAVYPFEIRKEGRIRIGHAWYLYDGNEEPFRGTMLRSEDYLLRLVDAVGGTPASEAASGPGASIDPRRVFLLGFSQGAYLGFFMAVRRAGLIQAFVSIGGRLRADFVAGELDSNRKLPILMLHGERDRSIPVERARESFDVLKSHGYPVEFQALPAGHEIQNVHLERIREWLLPRLG